MEFQSYMFVQVIFLLGVVLFLSREVILASKRPCLVERKQLFLLQLILFIGVLVRLIWLSYPNGVNVDEAMGGYDAWCIANYGVDSNLAQLPIYLRSWGCGQSAFYAYLAIPFINIFGLSPEVYRLPMALIGCCSILFFYWVLRKTQRDILLIFCLAAFFAINPWHIFKSRIGLDCNIFPDILLWAICFIILAYYSSNIKKQTLYNILGFCMVAISAYAYGVSWFMLPFLYILLFIFLLKRKKITKRAYFVSLVISFLLIAPLLCFCYLLITGGEQFQIGPITITTLLGTRVDEASMLSFSFLQNVKSWFKVLVLGVDIFPFNTFYPFGYFYNFLSLPLLFAGLFYSKQDKFPLNTIFGIWLICTLPILIVVSAGIYHWNALWIPLIFFAGYGIYKFALIGKPVRWLLFCLYAFSFIYCGYVYLDSRSYNPFDDYTYRDEIKFAQSLENIEEVYYFDHVIHPFILFYAPIDPYLYAKTRVNVGFPMVQAKSFGNVKIGLPKNISPLPKTAYVMSNDYIEKVDLSQFKVKQGKYYTVLWND